MRDEIPLVDVYHCYWNDTDYINLEVILDGNGKPWFEVRSLAAMIRNLNDEMDRRDGEIPEGTPRDRFETIMTYISEALQDIPPQHHREFNIALDSAGNAIDEYALSQMMNYDELYDVRHLRWWLVSKILPVLTADRKRRLYQALGG